MGSNMLSLATSYKEGEGDYYTDESLALREYSKITLQYRFVNVCV